MIISISINNYAIFAGDEEFSLSADMKIKRFPDNVYSRNGFNVVKAACLFGGNNSGKTCFVRAIKCIRNVILGEVEHADITPYRFGDNKICSLGVTFFYEDRIYRYEFKYDTSEDPARRGFVYERFQELSRDKYGNEKADEIFLRDSANSIYRVRDDRSLDDVLKIIPRDRILIHALDIWKNPVLKEISDVLTRFACMMDVISMKDIPIEKTVRILKYNEPLKERVREFIKASDIGIDDYVYVDDKADCQHQMAPGELRIPHNDFIVYPEDLDNLVSVHEGNAVKSVSFDSDGTLKLVALASYIIDAVDNGRVLVVDELDSSLHYKLTRAIVSIFNLDSNTCGQLIFTAHDVDLLDIQWLFRKDQIWFTSNHADFEDSADEDDIEDNDSSIIHLYSLDEFNAQESGIRSDSYLLDKYARGMLGSVPHPDYSEVIIDGLGRPDDNGKT